MIRLSIRCCCSPGRIYGFLDVAESEARAGARITRALRPAMWEKVGPAVRMIPEQRALLDVGVLKEAEADQMGRAVLITERLALKWDHALEESAMRLLPGFMAADSWGEPLDGSPCTDIIRKLSL